MTLEIIIILSIIIILIILARKMPDVKRQHSFSDKTSIVKDKMTDKKTNHNKKSVSENLFENAEELFEQGKTKQAEEIYIKLITVEQQKNPKIYNRLGVIYLQQKNFQDAKEAFNESLKFKDKKAGRYYNLALACLGLQELRNALEAIEKAIKLDKENSKYQTLYEDVKKRMKRFK